MRICIFLLIVLLGSVSEVSFVALCATEAKPRNAKKEKKQARLDRKQGETKTSSIGMPAIPEIANAPPLRPDGKLRMEVDQIKTAALWVDRYVGVALNKAGQKPNPPSDDFVFLRRIYLDAVGRIPTDDEASTFLKNKDPEKRRKLIDKLLLSDGYRSHLFNWLADLLRH
ncbi:MAG: DUF1549 domain-containing protein, partial [Opitutae bacterium]